MNNKIYAGIGARNTPKDILYLIKIIGICFASIGYTLNTGAAQGADQAFAEGAFSAGGKVNLFLPWPNYEKNWWSKYNTNIIVFNSQLDKEALNSVYQYHPNANRLKKSVITLHARNYLILKNAKFAICYTKNGAIIGGTGQAIRIMNDMNKKVFNLGKEEDRKQVIKTLGKM